MNRTYSVCILLCIISMAAMCFHVKGNNILTRSSKLWFFAMFTGIALGAAAECSGAYLDILPMPPALHWCCTLVEFSLTPMLSVLMSCACGVRKPAIPAGIFAVVHAVTELFCAPTGIIFYIDAAGRYHRGPWYEIYISSYAVSFGYLLVMIIILARNFRQRDFLTLLFAVLTLFAGLLPSIADKNVKTAFPSISVLAILLYVYYEDLTQQDLSENLAQRNQRIREMQSKTIIGVADLIESRDSNTGTHIKNTSAYVELLISAAHAEGLYPETLTARYRELVTHAAPLHDIGKISTPDRILQKPGPLTDEEYAIMKNHATEGGKIIRHILAGVMDEEYTQIAFDVANSHHERWDGQGYPNGLAGENIPLCARIMAIADVYDALTMKRVYKEAFPPEKALSIIAEEAGTHFDPVLAPLFVRVMRCRMDEQADCFENGSCSTVSRRNVSGQRGKKRKLRH